MAKKLKLWFDRELAEMLAEKLAPLQKGFPKKAFIKRVDEGVQPMELKDRVEHIADELDGALKGNYKEKAKTLLGIMGPANPEETGMFTEFYWLMPVATWVEKYGMEDWSTSMKMLEEVTKRNTSEYAIRPFITKYPEKTIQRMEKWSKSKDFHLRRLASEGGRPRLPWSSKLDLVIQNPKVIMPILTTLRDDKIKYVQKSVANALNDIGKDHPEFLKKTITSWSKDMTKERTWIIKHALRNWIKKEIPFAMEWKSEFVG